jgi:anionic cell wall polymer biosynthesis LytR-Cps2A-Psr (LCP) family protein
VISIKSIAKLKSIKAALQDNVQTNLSVEKALALLPTAAHLLQTPESIHRFTITEEQAAPSWSWNGMWILLPDSAAIDNLLKQAGMK